jgi:hypothetical protein
MPEGVFSTTCMASGPHNGLVRIACPAIGEVERQARDEEENSRHMAEAVSKYGVVAWIPI